MAGTTTVTVYQMADKYVAIGLGIKSKKELRKFANKLANTGDAYMEVASFDNVAGRSDKKILRRARKLFNKALRFTRNDFNAEDPDGCTILDNLRQLCPGDWIEVDNIAYLVVDEDTYISF